MQMQDSQIPPSVLAERQGIAIIPGMLRGAFVVGVQHGRGVLLIRDANRQWQAPRFIQMTGGSFGYQIGVQATDLVLVFRTPQSVNNVLRGTLKVGVDASAAAGPVGRQAAAGTDLSLSAEILSYSRARGAFIGVSIDGSSISLDPSAEAIYYQPPGTFPASAMTLLQTVSGLFGGRPALPPRCKPLQWPPLALAVGSPPEAAPAATPKPLANNWQPPRSQLAANLDDNWKRYLALPREVYTAEPGPQSAGNATGAAEVRGRRPQPAIRGPASPPRIPTNAHCSAPARRRADRVQHVAPTAAAATVDQPFSG